MTKHVSFEGQELLFKERIGSVYIIPKRYSVMKDLNEL